MNDVYIKATDINTWISKYFKNQDLISVGDLIGCIENLDMEIDRLKEELEDEKQDKEDNYVARPRSDYTGDTYDDRF